VHGGLAGLLGERRGHHAFVVARHRHVERIASLFLPLISSCPSAPATFCCTTDPWLDEKSRTKRRSSAAGRAVTLQRA
jgi:hypothetical protein